MKRNILIIGAGLTGLSSALFLADKGYTVELVEKSDKIGGLASTFQYKGNEICFSPHQLFTHNQNMLELLTRFGLNPYWHVSNTGIYSTIAAENKVYPLTTPFDLLTFKSLSFKDRLKLAYFASTLVLNKKRNVNYHYLKEINAEEWLCSVTSKEIYLNFFYPMLINKFNINLSEVSAEWLAGRLTDLLGTKGQWGYIDGGIHIFFQKIQKELESKKVTISINTSVTQIIAKGNNICSVSLKNVVNKKEKKIKPSLIISTIPIPLLLDIQQGFPDDYIKKLQQIKYTPYIGGIFITEKTTSPYHIVYYLNSLIGGFNEFTNLYPKYPFKVLYVFKYLNKPEGIWNDSVTQLKDKFIGEIKKPYQSFNPDAAFIIKEQYAAPIFKKDYEQYKPAMVTPIQNLFLAGMFGCYPHIRDMEAAVMEGKKVANHVSSLMMK